MIQSTEGSSRLEGSDKVILCPPICSLCAEKYFRDCVEDLSEVTIYRV